MTSCCYLFSNVDDGKRKLSHDREKKLVITLRTKYYEHYLDDKKFVIKINHKSLVYLKTQKDLLK